jgi:hypothetical protein
MPHRFLLAALFFLAGLCRPSGAAAQQPIASAYLCHVQGRVILRDDNRSINFTFLGEARARVIVASNLSDRILAGVSGSIYAESSLAESSLGLLLRYYPWKWSRAWSPFIEAVPARGSIRDRVPFPAGCTACDSFPVVSTSFFQALGGVGLAFRPQSGRIGAELAAMYASGHRDPLLGRLPGRLRLVGGISVWLQSHRR